MKLNPNEIHIWQLDLKTISIPSLTSGSLLSPDEHERANRFVDGLAQLHFIVARSALRQILGQYLQIPPKEIRFEYGIQKKPSLASDLSPCPLAFNLSHSKDHAILAVARGSRKIGIDLEEIREIRQMPAIIKRYFSPQEQEDFRALPAHQQSRAFFRVWCQKEAFIKAWGEGIGTVPLRQLEFSLAPEKPAEIRAVPSLFQESQGWFISDLKVPAKYAACLIAERLINNENLFVQNFELRS